jgi:hypothetical protein
MRHFLDFEGQFPKIDIESPGGMNAHHASPLRQQGVSPLQAMLCRGRRVERATRSKSRLPDAISGIQLNP